MYLLVMADPGSLKHAFDEFSGYSQYSEYNEEEAKKLATELIILKLIKNLLVN